MSETPGFQLLMRLRYNSQWCDRIILPQYADEFRREISPLLRTHGPLRSLWKTVMEITAKPIAAPKCLLERWLSSENQHQMLHLAKRLRGSYTSDCCVMLPKGFCQYLTDLHQQHQFQSCFAFCHLSVCLQNLIDSYKDVLISVKYCLYHNHSNFW